MTHEDCGMSIKTKGGKTYERESVRNKEKEKRRKKRKEPSFRECEKSKTTQPHDKTYL